MTDSSEQIYIGVNLPARQGISNQRVVDAALTRGYDLITSRITSRTYRKRVQMFYASEEPDPEITPPVGEDLVVFPGTHVSNTIALCAPWAELDSKDARIADLSYKVLEQEMRYAKFCGLPYVVIEGPKRRTNLARYAHSLTKLIRLFPDLKIMIHTTFTEDFRDGQPPPDLLSTWDVWDGVRVLCDHPPNLGVTLEVQHARIPDSVVSRWMCEPIMMLVLGEARAFVPNPKNYPVLPKHTQLVMRRLAALRPFFLIKENLGPNKPVEFNGGDDACLLYLRNMLSKPDPRLSHASEQSRASRNVDAEIGSLRPESYGSGYSSGGYGHEWPGDLLEPDTITDVLEHPLQPLQDSLDNSVYEVFESDATKYNQYFKAAVAAINSLTASSSIASDSPIVIAVLGAGRGALVDRVIDAIVATRISATHSVIIYAVEKQAGPLAYLHARKSSEPVWEAVHVVHADMRSWIPEQPAHLVVSELLGSLGDNELSPECLANVERSKHVLVPHGIMIPASYTSYLTPVLTPLLWSKARSSSPKGLETPYVVNLLQVERLAEPQRAWSYTHPTSSVFTSRKQAKLTFAINTRSRIYGIAGYFEAELFQGIKLSTLPSTKTAGLNSWFPMLFPIKEPLEVFPDSSVDVSFWRECDQQRVWYEWAVETQHRRCRAAVSTLHNSAGHAQSMNI